MNVVEPIADAVTGGLTARAAEPPTGVDDSNHTTERACLNCGTPLAGDYCHACGQKGHVHRTLGSIAHDLLHGVLHFEGKIWHTLPMLAWRPGELTRRYIDGQRARFVSPLALFLFSVFLLAAVLGALPGKGFLDGLADGLTDAPRQIERASTEIDTKIATLDRQRTEALAANRPTATIDRRLAELREERRGLAAVASGTPSSIILSANQKSGSTVLVEQSRSRSAFPLLDQQWEKAKKNPELLIYKMKNSAYKYSWLLVPMSVPFLWLLFPFSRRFRMYDHAIFAIYSLSFMSLLVIALALLSQAGVPGGVIAALTLAVPPVHIFRQLRGTYGLRKRSALLRTMVLLFFAMFVLSLWIAILMLLGAF